MKCSCLAIIIFAAIAASATADDVVGERLGKAVVVCESELRDARTSMLAEYQELIQSLAKEGKVELSLKVREEMKVFESDGILCGRAELKDAVLNYGRVNRSVRETLGKAYEQAVKDYLVAGELKKSDNITSKIAELPAMGRLVSLENPKRRGYFIQHADYLGWLRKADDDSTQLNATFEIVSGLAQKDAVSFRSVNVPDRYLAHGDLRLYLAKTEDSDVFRQNATFKQAKGLSSATAYSFESINFPGHFIRARDDALHLQKYDGSVKFKSDATFTIAGPLYKF